LLYIIVMKIKNVPQFISPERVLHEVGLKAGMNVIDYASGAGHWSQTAAKLVAPSGRVLAIENDINMLNLLRSRAETQHIGNIDIEELELEKGISKLATPSDLVIVSNILHLIRGKEAFAKKATDLLVPGGKLIFIDWTMCKTLFGPPLELRMSEESAVSLFEKAGLVLESKLSAGVDHFGLVFIKGEVKADE